MSAYPCFNLLCISYWNMPAVLAAPFLPPTPTHTLKILPDTSTQDASGYPGHLRGVIETGEDIPLTPLLAH